jgi:hypothetical protein
MTNKKKLNVLVACEESQAVTKELLELGHNAFSCDLLPCSGGKIDRHFKMDVFEVIEKKGGVLQNGVEYYIGGNWDLMIAHPPCTFLAVSGAQWYYDPKDKHLPTSERKEHPLHIGRADKRDLAVDFFKKLWNVDIDNIVIENPIGIMSTKLHPPHQIVHPYMFGDEATKATCFWIKGVIQKLTINKSEEVGRGAFLEFPSGKKMQTWYADALSKTKTPEERRTMRSKTFPGMAKAMAKQWTEDIINY